jgi:hypothetical protein
LTGICSLGSGGWFCVGAFCRLQLPWRSFHI